MITYTEKELIDFEEEIANCFNEAEIKAPVHLYSGNESQMLSIFKTISPNDWVLCTWRSHYQCLLKGVPREVLKRDIINGKSISFKFTNSPI